MTESIVVHENSLECVFKDRAFNKTPVKSKDFAKERKILPRYNHSVYVGRRGHLNGKDLKRNQLKIGRMIDSRKSDEHTSNFRTYIICLSLLELQQAAPNIPSILYIFQIFFNQSILPFVIACHTGEEKLIWAGPLILGDLLENAPIYKICIFGSGLGSRLSCQPHRRWSLVYFSAEIAVTFQG